MNWKKLFLGVALIGSLVGCSPEKKFRVKPKEEVSYQEEIINPIDYSMESEGDYLTEIVNYSDFLGDSGVEIISDKEGRLVQRKERSSSGGIPYERDTIYFTRGDCFGLCSKQPRIRTETTDRRFKEVIYSSMGDKIGEYTRHYLKGQLDSEYQIRRGENEELVFRSQKYFDGQGRLTYLVQERPLVDSYEGFFEKGELTNLNYEVYLKSFSGYIQLFFRFSGQEVKKMESMFPI